jgi:hypothetical protein
MKPMVGQQLTVNLATAAAGASRLALMQARATAGDCDLTAQARLIGREEGFIYQNGTWITDTTLVPPIPDATFQQFVGLFTDAITYTCVPPGSGWRVAVDRDSDGFANFDEILNGTNPADATSHP